MKLTTETIKGKKCEIHVLENGNFQTTLDGNVLHAESLDKLRARIASSMRKASVKVEIPVVWWARNPRVMNGGRIERGSFTGIHARTENLLIKYENGKADQLSSWGDARGKYFPPEHEARLAELGKAFDAAKYALDDYGEKFAYDILEQIKAIVAKAESAE